MADWPRAIKPEDRVKYLIQARQDLNIDWDDQGLTGVSDHGERVWIYIGLGGNEKEDTFQAVYATDHSPELLLGEFSTVKEAKKALIDHLVVTWAVQQAWEDVAT